MLADGSFGEIIDAVKNSKEETKLLCRVYSKTKNVPMFVQPCDAKLINAVICKDEDVKMKLICQNDLKKRAIMLHDFERKKATFMSVVHSCSCEFDSQ